MPPIAPQRTGKPLQPLSITGYLLPVQKNGQPMLLRMPGTDKLYIPVFETKAKLDALWRCAPLPRFDRVMIIDDGRVFLASIRENQDDKLVVIADPHMLENQRVRFIQIFQDGEDIPPGNPS